VIGIVVGAIAIGAAVGGYTLFSKARGGAALKTAQPGGQPGSDSGQTTMADTQEILSPQWPTNNPGATDSVFDQLSDEIC
jgi:hypothetical protein